MADRTVSTDELPDAIESLRESAQSLCDLADLLADANMINPRSLLDQIAMAFDLCENVDELTAEMTKSVEPMTKAYQKSQNLIVNKVIK